MVELEPITTAEQGIKIDSGASLSTRRSSGSTVSLSNTMISMLSKESVEISMRDFLSLPGAQEAGHTQLEDAKKSD
jgi:hypothetical protein